MRKADRELMREAVSELARIRACLYTMELRIATLVEVTATWNATLWEQQIKEARDRLR
jgi:hypothetical protein